MFISEMKSMNVPLSRYAPQTYDAVWAIALALKGAETAWSTPRQKTGDRILKVSISYNKFILDYISLMQF